MQPLAEDRGYRAHPRVPFAGIPGLAHAIRFCRDGDTSIAELFKRVPAEYARAASLIRTREPVHVVVCVCGAQTVATTAHMAECKGRCGRWFIRDDRGPWSAKLPDQEPDE